MNEQLDSIIDLLEEISDKLFSINTKLDRLSTNQIKTPKMDESYGFVRGAEYYANLDKRNIEKSKE